MQLLVLALVIGIFLHDMNPPWHPWPDVTGWALLAVILMPKLALGALYWLICWLTKRQLGTARGRFGLRTLERFSAVYRYVAVLLYSIDLYVGGLRELRQTFVDTVLLDEILFMLPTLLLLVWSWWAYHPIDRRLREAALIGRIDAGLPVPPIWSRGQYMLAQVRHQIAMILVPLLLIVAWEECVRLFGPRMLPGPNPQALLIVVGAGCVFLVAPVMIRHIWDTAPLPEGQLRRSLLSMCELYRVGCRELLLWRTFGGMINAAVMGVFAPVRYILLTDALLEMLPQVQVEAVMAHELAHVKKKHLFWLLVIAVASMGALQMACIPLVNIAANSMADSGLTSTFLRRWFLDQRATEVAGTIATLLCWLPVFGWVSRRFERQADTFAVLHLERAQTEPEVEHGSTVGRRSAEIMNQALQHVAELNNIGVNRRSWRHGAIAWRQNHLHRLVGQPIDHQPIDRQVGWIKFAGAVAMVLVIAAVFVVGMAPSSG